MWLKLPEDGVIQYTPLPSDRWTLKFPPKTIVDRVDYWALGSDPSEPTFDPAQGVVLDVRGAELDARGKTRWRVMRPERSGRGAPLFGYSWPRGDSVAASYVVDTMVAAMSEGMGFYAKLSGDKLTRGQHRYRTISACNSCHPRNKPETTAIHKRRDHLYRATDDHGWFTPRSVFAKAIPFETYRPRDLNGEQPWLQALCPSGDAAKRSSMKGNDTWTCEGDGVPRGTLALASACAAGDRHARAVCETRRSLFERLDPAGKKALAAMVAACESCQDR